MSSNLNFLLVFSPNFAIALNDSGYIAWNRFLASTLRASLVRVTAQVKPQNSTFIGYINLKTRC